MANRAEPSSILSTAPAGLADQPDPRRWRVLSVTLTAGFMGLLDVSIVTVALPSIERSLGSSPSGVQWVVSGYALAFGLALVPAGRLGDAWGRRQMFLLALSGFVMTSALAGAAATLPWLIAARLAQGCAAGMLSPQNSGLIQDLFRGPERGQAFGLFGATVGLSTAIGPVVGGVILAVFGEPEGWRWVFYVNVPIGLLALVLAFRLVPVNRRNVSEEVDPVGHLDLVGTALLGSGVLAMLWPLLQQDAIGRLWWLFVLAALLLAGFVSWEIRVTRIGRSAPLLDLRLVTSTPGYASGAGLGLTYFVGFSGIWLVFAMFFQTGLGYSALRSGLAVTPFAVGSAVSAMVAGRAVSQWGRRLTVLGLFCVAAGLSATAFLLRGATSQHAAWLTAGPLLFAGLGGGLVISPNITLTLSAVPVRMAGAAGGALQTSQRIGSAIGTALLASVYYSTLAAPGRSAGSAVFVALLCAVGVVLMALLLAVLDLRREARRPLNSG